MTETLIENFAEIQARLKDRDYYEILGLDATASKEAVRMAYFRESKVYHPDRYFRNVGARDLAIVSEIYQTIAEAYRILSDSVKRRQYDRGLAQNRLEFLRFDLVKLDGLKEKTAGAEGGAAAAATKKPPTEAIARTAMGKKYVKEALNLMKLKSYGPAELQIKLAVSVEADNPDIKALADEISQLKGKASGKNSYTIK